MRDDLDRPDPIGQTVGNYKILRKLSTGGMGTVYYAEHALIGRTAAIKILHPELSGSKEIVGRFFNEAKATTSIKHPGIVEVFDYGYMPNGDGYIIMEFLEGMSLARRLKKGGYGEGEAAMLIRGVCSALSAAHQKGIIHRDLKPDNIFLVDDPEAPIGERPKVLDFGIAKLTDIGLAGEGTKTGAVMGTPTYMSPEQCKGTGNVDLRADLYSLGCILYELVCGRPPFKNLGAGELIGAHQHLQPDPPSTYAPNITPEMSDLIVSLLQKDPAKRVQTAPELAQKLAKIAARHGYQISMTHITPVPSMVAVSPIDTDSKTTSEDPTTLTRGAAESIATPGTKKRSALWKIAPVVAVLAAAGVALATFNAMKKDEAPHPAAATPAPVETVKPPEPTPPPPPTPPPVEEEKPPIEDVKPVAPVEPPPPAPVETKAETKAETKVVKKPKPKKPVAKPVAKPPPTTPPPKPKGPLETDI